MPNVSATFSIDRMFSIGANALSNTSDSPAAADGLESSPLIASPLMDVILN